MAEILYRRQRFPPRSDTSSKPAIVTARAVVIGTLLSGALLTAGAGASAGDGPPAHAGFLAGNTLSAVIWVPRSAATPGSGALSRFMLQAYLRRDGSALIRVWDAVRNAYTQPAERNWTLSDSRLCLDLPTPGPGRICADVHSWGPRIAGIGTRPYVMLDGDLKPGNALFAAR
jgi:hypothetical protein